MLVQLESPVKFMRLQLTNNSNRRRHLSATYFAELVLGSYREEAPMQLVCTRDEKTQALSWSERNGDDFRRKSGVRGVQFAPKFSHGRPQSLSGAVWIGRTANCLGAQTAAACIWVLTRPLRRANS